MTLEGAEPMHEPAKIAAIYRYPVKGLSAESLASTRLTVGETIPADRLYAIENGPSGFDPAAPTYLPKQRFLMLMRNARLARLRARFDAATHVLAIELEGASVARGDLRTPEGRAGIERFFAEFCADELRGPPRLLQAAGHSFSNVAGWPAWHEFSLLDREIGIGSAARAKIVKRTERCAATEVDPRTAARDLPIPRTLLQTFGHADCGVYAEVVADGEIAVGNAVTER